MALYGDADLDIASLLIHADTIGERETSVGVPISTSTTFRNPPPSKSVENGQARVSDEGVSRTMDEEGSPPFDPMNPERHVYSRYTQPTLTRVEKVLSALLKSHALSFSSGLSAVFAVMLFHQPQIIAIQRGYHGTHETIALYAKTRGNVQVIDIDDDYEQYKGKNFMCWLETPVNPEGTCRDMEKCLYSESLDISDDLDTSIPDATKTHSIEGKIVIDSTFGPPPLQDPFNFGADVVMHSATKYLAGHSDALIGVLAVKDKKDWQKLWEVRTYSGMVPGSLEAWLLLRSLRTVNLRVPRQSSTATALALWLNTIATQAAKAHTSQDGCPGGVLKRVWHAALQGEENGFYPLACETSGKKAQMSGGPACFSILTSKKEYADWLPHMMNLMVPATSLGGVESLIEQRVLSDARENPCLIRLSVGLEDLEDLKEDFRNAIRAVIEKVDRASDKLSIPLPEITFGNNVVSLHRKGKQRAVAASGISFNALDALAQVNTKGDENIKVAYADAWAQSRRVSGTAEGGGVIQTIKNFDWTYSTDYAGTRSDEMSFTPAPYDHPGIPLSKLAKTDEPILFYDDVMLFEDELHDNGVANLSVKIRVMPSSFFALSRFFLRVDNVIFRVHDVRIYHNFDTNEVIREVKGKEAAYSDVKKRLPQERPDDLTPLTDSNWVANVIGMLEIKRHSPGGSSSSEEAIISAPWATNAAGPGRKLVAPGVSVPFRSPDTFGSRSPKIPKDDQREKVNWKGIGTTVQVATLAKI
ncbi:MAG: hypothetical protein CYPHOPRED_005760 [Cyphobasidiales sp. Tagirdzhanova-0007]|nr:MAG: hypothetical protein CYPHOPRED_005760 [Cyphobasidiales sp. Tagirdzhanova-0007]